MVSQITSYEINRLTDLERGEYGSDESIDSDTFTEEWSLDSAGNWSNYKRDTTPDGTWDVNHARTHNGANEITQVAGSSSLVDHDAAGNMTKLPQPGDWSDDYELTFDGWNRLVAVEDGSQYGR